MTRTQGLAPRLPGLRRLREPGPSVVFRKLAQKLAGGHLTLPRIDGGQLHAGAIGSVAHLVADAARIGPSLAHAYRAVRLAPATGAPGTRPRADQLRDNAAAAVVDRFFDGVAELDVFALLLGGIEVPGFVAAIAAPLAAWDSRGAPAAAARARHDHQAAALIAAVDAALTAHAATPTEAARAPLVELLTQVARDPATDARPSALRATLPPPVRAALVAARTAATDARRARDQRRAAIAAIGRNLDRVARTGGELHGPALVIAARAHELAALGAGIAQAWPDACAPHRAAVLAAIGEVTVAYQPLADQVRRLLRLPE